MSLIMSYIYIDIDDIILIMSLYIIVTNYHRSSYCYILLPLNTIAMILSPILLLLLSSLHTIATAIVITGSITVAIAIKATAVATAQSSHLWGWEEPRHWGAMIPGTHKTEILSIVSSSSIQRGFASTFVLSMAVDNDMFSSCLLKNWAARVNNAS